MEPFSLIVFVSPTIPAAQHGRELTFSQKLATYYLLGGHVLLAGVPGAGSYPQSGDSEVWDGLMHYFWNIGLHDITSQLEDSDHRAVFVPGAVNLGDLPQFRQTVQTLLAARDELPSQIPAEDFGPAPRVTLRQNSLWIDDRPQLLKSVGYYDFLESIPTQEHDAALRLFHETGFNSAVVIAHYDVSENHLREFLDIARKYKIYIQLQLQGPVDSDEPVRKEYLFRGLRFRNHPALIGWTMSDDMWDVYFPFIQKAVSILRQFDHRLPITSTAMDNRRPEKVQDWVKWKSLTDFPLTYIYPMQRDAFTEGHRGELQGGLKDIDLLEASTHKLWGDLFSEQFLQAHMQGGFAEEVGLKSWTEHLMPVADQERLIAYRALISGVKGLVFFYPESLENQGMGRNRRNELGIVWSELAPVEDILAAGARPEPLTTSDPSVNASLIRSGNDAVIVAVRDETHYNRYVDHAQVQDLKVNLPAGLADCPVYQMSWPEAEKLETRPSSGGRTVALRPFALTSVSLWSCNEARQRQAQETLKKNLPDAARFAIEVLADEDVKTIVVSRHLPRDLQGNAAMLEAAAKARQDARNAAQADNWAAAWLSARAGVAAIEEYRAQAILAATADADRQAAGMPARMYLNLYFSLPNYAYVMRGGAAVAPGQLRKEILEAEGEPVWDVIDRVAH